MTSDVILQTLVPNQASERAASAGAGETLWHVTVLSNFARGYDKYSRRYSKGAIPESTFPDRFFLLQEEELAAGVRKAAGLLRKLGLAGDRLVALRTEVPAVDLRENTRTGIGRFVEREWILLSGVAWLGAGAGDGQAMEDGAAGGDAAGPGAGEEKEPVGFGKAAGGGIDSEMRLVPAVLEEVMAASLRVLHGSLAAFEALRPRSFSVLPVARGCQASCPFCFSEASASAEQDQARLNLERVAEYAGQAARRGAERFVITGGGEPGLLRHGQLCGLIEVGSAALGKAVLITNGHHLARKDELSRAVMLEDYAKAGLEVLAVSRHHHDDAASARLMSLETDVRGIARTWAKGAGGSGTGAGSGRWPGLRMRLICVLQRGGVDSLRALEDYVSWAVECGIGEICFKELYVSTSGESVYHRHAANAWSHAHQVPLSLVLDFAERYGLFEVSRLPWGSPVFQGEWRGAPVKIAAYTEPSLFWERAHGIARSWNLMAGGQCLVSLEDRASVIQLPTIQAA